MSQRIHRVFNKVMNEHKPVSVAMKEEGYHPNTTRNPHQVTRSKRWLELMEKNGLGEDQLLKRHKELVKSKREDIAVKAVDMAYKVSGKYNQSNQSSTSKVFLINITPPDTKDMAPQSPHIYTPLEGSDNNSCANDEGEGVQGGIQNPEGV